MRTATRRGCVERGGCREGARHRSLSRHPRAGGNAKSASTVPCWWRTALERRVSPCAVHCVSPNTRMRGYTRHVGRTRVSQMGYTSLERRRGARCVLCVARYATWHHAVTRSARAPQPGYAFDRCTATGVAPHRLGHAGRATRCAGAWRALVKRGGTVCAFLPASTSNPRSQFGECPCSSVPYAARSP